MLQFIFLSNFFNLQESKDDLSDIEVSTPTSRSFPMAYMLTFSTAYLFVVEFRMRMTTRMPQMKLILRLIQMQKMKRRHLM